jgi:type IX secretion system PorP/SprF family membrane protein
MHSKRARIAFLIFQSTLSFCAWAQDPHFSQFYANPLYTNPAAAGVTYSDGGGRVGINYRNQWKGLYSTFIGSWDQEFKKLKGGIGIMIMDDHSGDNLILNKSVSAIYSFKHTINKKLNLHYGLQTEWSQKTIDWNRLRYEDQIDPTGGFINPTTEPLINKPKNTLNFSLGVLANHKHFFGGLAVHNLTEPNVSLLSAKSIWPRRFTVHGGYNFEFESAADWQLSPQILLMQQSKYKQMNVGALASYKWLTFGTFYRHSLGYFSGPTDLIGVLGVKVKKWRLAYSYDRVVSGASNYLSHSHELSISFAYCNKKVSKETHKGMMW